MLEPPEQELELLIGLTFRLTSNDMAFTSDVMTNAGYVVPKNAQLTATTSLTDVHDPGHAARISSTISMGSMCRSCSGASRASPASELIERASLHPIERYLRTRSARRAAGHADDVILSRDEMAVARGRVRRPGAHLPDRRPLRQHGPARVRARDAAS